MKKIKIVGMVFIVFLCMSLTTVAYFDNSNQSVQKQVTQNSKHHEHQLQTKILVQPSATQDGIEQEFVQNVIIKILNLMFVNMILQQKLFQKNLHVQKKV